MILKENLKRKILYLSGILFFIFFILNFDNYTGSKLIFFIFNLVSFFLFLTLIKFKLTSFEFFFYIFLLLSFWFKYSCILYFDNITVTEGDFGHFNADYDRSTVVIIFSFLTCICSSVTRKFIFNDFLDDKTLNLKKIFTKFYKDFRFIILLGFIITLLIVWTSNYYFKIYSKGIVNQETPLYIKHFFSWSFTYGLSIITSILIYIDFLIYKNKKYFFLGFFETFFTHMTIYSRAFFVSIFAYLRGYYYLIRSIKIKLSKEYLFKIILFGLIFSFISFFFVNQLRYSNFQKPENIKSLKIETAIFEAFHLSVNRWVGIDGLLSVSQSKDLSYDFFVSSLDEKKEIRNKSFYINNFFKNFKYSEKENDTLNIVITPGLIAFLYYSGSIFFVCISIFTLILFCSLIEKLFLYFSGKNIILSNLIGYTLAMRLIHFGYVPYNTINFLLSFIITLIGVYFLTKLISENNTKI